MQIKPHFIILIKDIYLVNKPVSNNINIATLHMQVRNIIHSIDLAVALHVI